MKSAGQSRENTPPPVGAGGGARRRRDGGIVHCPAVLICCHDLTEGLSKNHVIASQCSHWRGNPPDIQIFSILNQQLLRSTGGFPHQSAIYYGMIATGNHHYFNSLRGAPLVRNEMFYQNRPLYQFATNSAPNFVKPAP